MIRSSTCAGADTIAPGLNNEHHQKFTKAHDRRGIKRLCLTKHNEKIDLEANPEKGYIIVRLIENTTNTDAHDDVLDCICEEKANISTPDQQGSGQIQHYRAEGRISILHGDDSM
jgi:hypothetical protein